MTRERELATMLRGTSFDGALRDRIAPALRAFSLSQLAALRAVGVRFWHDGAPPPPFAGLVSLPAMSTRAAYVAEIRTIRLRAGAYQSDVRHELAHAWDHVRTGTVSGSPDRASPTVCARMVRRPVRMWSDSATRHAVAVGGTTVRLTVEEMRRAYLGRARLREQAFDNPATREGYSRTNAREFYAEGYSVFHGSARSSQRALLLRAPELYDLLRREAVAQGLGVPDAAALRAADVP